MAKEQTPAQAQGQSGALPPGHPDTSGTAAPALEYKRPAGWQEAAPGQMRAASFRVAGKDGKQADVSVIPLPGLAGSDLDNVNRWRGQVGSAGRVGGGAGQARPSRSRSPANRPGSMNRPARMPVRARRAASWPPSRAATGVAWFFKMTGDDGVVAEQKPAFIEFLKSVSFPAGTAQAQLPPAHPPIDGGGMMPQAQLPPDHPPIDGGGMMAQAGAAASSGQPKPNWEVPSGWKEVPGGQFLVAKFMLAGATNAQASVNVSMSAGDGGGLLANVNRWRSQLGLGPLTEADLAKEIQPLDLPGGKASVADITGQDAKNGQEARLLAVVIPRSGQTWFYKLMGNAQVVQQEKEAFMKFVQSVKY